MGGPHGARPSTSRRSPPSSRARGHRVLIVAPSESAAPARASSRARAARGARGPGRAARHRRASRGLFFAGEVLSATRPRRRGAAARRRAHGRGAARALVPLDFVHVHEPFAPSTASAALRHSRALNIGSFHAPTERSLSTQVARRFVELFFGRLDARIASYGATARADGVPLPGRLPRGRCRWCRPADRRRARVGARTHIVFIDEEERAALRTFLRAAAAASTPSADWEATVLERPRRLEPGPAARATCASACASSSPATPTRDALLASADVVVLASAGALPAPGLALAAIGARAVPLASRLAVYEEVLGDGERGLLFEPGDVDTLAAQLARLIGDAALRERLAARRPSRCARRSPAARVADELEEVYETVAARRRPLGAPAHRKRRRRTARADRRRPAHAHRPLATTARRRSRCCSRPPRSRASARSRSPTTTRSPARSRRRAKADGIKVIVAEEIKTATRARSSACSCASGSRAA